MESKKKTLLDWYLSLNKVKQEIFWIGLVDLVVFIILVPFFILGYLSLSIGWLIGSLVSILSHLSISWSAKLILSEVNSEKKRGTFIGLIFFFLRFFLWAVVLIISAISTFKPEWFNGFSLISFWTVFASYLPGLVVSLVSNIISKKKNQVDSTTKENK